MQFEMAFGLWLGVSLLVAALAGARRGAMLGVALCLLLLPLPFLSPPVPLVRLFLAAAIVWLALRAMDLAARPHQLSFAVRWAHLVLPPDFRFLGRAERRLDWGSAVMAVVLVAACFVVAELLSGWPHPVLQWLVVGAGTLAAFELAGAVIRVASGAAGVTLPAVNDSPLKSRSLSEFWAKRWNLPVTRMLNDLCFRPLARRNTTMALIASFVASAAFHAYPMFAAAGATAALLWAAFFLLQPLAIAAERHIGLRNAPNSLRRLWTFAILLVLLPLFAEPLLMLGTVSTELSAAQSR